MYSVRYSARYSAMYSAIYSVGCSVMYSSGLVQGVVKRPVQCSAVQYSAMYHLVQDAVTPVYQHD